MRTRIRIRLFTTIRIRILLLITVTRVCDHWSTDPPVLYLEPSRPWLSTAQFWASEALEFDFDADPDPAPAFHSNADPDRQPWHVYTCRQRGRAKTVASFFQVKLMASEDVDAALDNQSINNSKVISDPQTFRRAYDKECRELTESLQKFTKFHEFWPCFLELWARLGQNRSLLYQTRSKIPHDTLPLPLCCD